MKITEYAEVFNTHRKEFNFQDGDILIVNKGTKCGEIYRYADQLKPQVLNNALVIRPKTPTDLYTKLKAKEIEIKQLIKGTTMQTIFTKSISELDV